MTRLPDDNEEVEFFAGNYNVEGDEDDGGEGGCEDDSGGGGDEKVDEDIGGN